MPERLDHRLYEIDGWGVGELWLRGAQVAWHEPPRPGYSGAGAPPLVGELKDLLEAYFAAQPVSFAEVDLDLEYETPFLERCARALRQVSWGQVVSYGELAALAGSPGAARAAGSFCGRNRLSLFVPCHRVVAASGLGGFGSLGTDYKRRLLRLEGVVAD